MFLNLTLLIESRILSRFLDHLVNEKYDQIVWLDVERRDYRLRPFGSLNASSDNRLISNRIPNSSRTRRTIASFAGISNRTLEHVSRIERYDRHVPARHVQDNISKQRHVSWQTAPGTCRDLSKHLLTLGSRLEMLRFVFNDATYDITIYSRTLSRRSLIFAIHVCENLLITFIYISILL